jgi:O-methyltransferase
MNPSIIYGAGCQGVALLRLIQKNADSTDVHCFVDSHPDKQGLTVEGLPVYPPDYLISPANPKPTVAVAVGGHYPVIRKLLEKLGLEEDRNFYDATPRPLHYRDLEPGFAALRDKVRRHTLVSEDRLALLYQLSFQARKVRGDLAEIGVYRGGTALLMAESLRGSTRQLHLFDTFCGMPTSDPAIDLHRPGDFADTSVEAVSSLLCDYPNAHLHPGLFPATLPVNWSNKAFSLVHVDVDIYASALACCEFFYPRLNPGGAMIFDDYGFPSCPGVRQAVDEYCRNHDLQLLYLQSGQALLYRF